MTHNFWDTTNVRARAPPLNFYLWATGPPLLPVHTIYLLSIPILPMYLPKYQNICLVKSIILTLLSVQSDLIRRQYIGWIDLKTNIFLFKQLILKVIWHRAVFLIFFYSLYISWCALLHTVVHTYSLVYILRWMLKAVEEKKMNFELPMFQDFRGSSDGPIHLTFIVHLVR